VPRGSWQGSLPLGKEPDSYSMIGNTLAPSFDYSDFEMGYRTELQQAYPRYAELIAQLTRKEFLTRPQAAAAMPRASPPGGGQEPTSVAVSVDELKTVQAAPGMALAEVVGRVAAAHSERCSIAAFTLEAGKRSSTSLNKEAEEYFIVTEGTGTVRVGSRQTTVVPGTVVIVPPRTEHSLQAAASGNLHFYAVSAPAFSPQDYVVTSEPQH
jgi:uncharacterized protein